MRRVWIGSASTIHIRGRRPFHRGQISNAALDAKLLHLIISLEHARPKLKLWRIDGGSVTPIELVFETGATDDEVGQFSMRQRIAIAVVGIASLLLLVAISVTLLPPAPELTTVP